MPGSPPWSAGRWRIIPARSGRSSRPLDLLDVGGLVPLGTFGHLKLHALALFQRLESIARPCGVVNEDVLPIVLRDESVPLLIAEPFDDPLCHRGVPSYPSKKWS